MGKLHHLNVGCADCSVIQSSTATFLIDCHNIDQHTALLPKSKKLRGVFVTHQHYDHYSGLEYLRKNGYSLDYLIYSPYQRRYNDSSVTIDEWNEFKSHKDYFEKKGTKLRAPYRQSNWNKPWWNTNGVKFEIIGPAKGVATSDTRELHDGCLVIKAIMGKRKCLFTGDASDTNLEYIEKNTKNFCNDILHASHHGSINGAHLKFIKKCNAKYTVISTASGIYGNIPHSTALERYRNNTKEKVYRTDKNGSLKWSF
tara:strand:+ start:469 stop:1236 length:768 start_codon:yes stop_codon:yes gene_type:complete